MGYRINYQTGAGNVLLEWTECDDLEEVMEMAEDGVCFTQESVKIEKYDGDEYVTVAKLPWYGCAAGDEDEVVIDYGEYGYYGPWVEY